jgi:DNA repair protein RadC
MTWSAGVFLDLPLLDHVIVARERYYSFSDSGGL